MSSSTEAVAALHQEYERLKAFLAAIRPTPGSLLVGETAVRYGWWTLQSAQALHSVLRDGHALGAPPLLRQLQEARLEVMLFTSWPENDGGPWGAAARSYVWSILAWDKEWRRYEQALRQAPTPVIERVERTEDAAQAFETKRRVLAAQGDDVRWLDQAWEAFTARRKLPYHWTGKRTYRQRLTLLEKLLPQQEIMRAVVEWGAFFWGRGSAATHVSPGWDRIHVLHDPGGPPRFGIRGTMDDKIADQAAMAAKLTQTIFLTLRSLFREGQPESEVEPVGSGGDERE